MSGGNSEFLDTSQGTTCRQAFPGTLVQVCVNSSAPAAYHSVDAPHKHGVEQVKPDPEEDLLNDPICVKHKTVKTTRLEVRRVFTHYEGVRRVWKRAEESWGAASVLFLHVATG